MKLKKFVKKYPEETLNVKRVTLPLRKERALERCKLQLEKKKVVNPGYIF
jgi:hypothetical protein